MNEAGIEGIDVQALTEAYSHGGWLAVMSVGVMLIIKAWRSNNMQTALETTFPKLAWASWPLWLRITVVVATATLSSVLGAVAVGVPLVSALIGAVPVALGAIGAHELVATVTRPPAEPPMEPEVHAMMERRSLRGTSLPPLQPPRSAL